MEPKWLEWAKALQSITQTGLHYTEGVFDRERYRQIQEIAADIVATYTSVDPQVVRDLYAAEQGPSTPKVDVRGVAFKDDALLMVRETLDEGRWTLPGGWADVNESPAEACVREVFEESGFRARAVKLLAVVDKSKHAEYPPALFHVYKLFFLCEITGGEAADSIETSGVGFFREADLPHDLSVVRVSRPQLLRFFEQRRHPEWQTDFD